MCLSLPTQSGLVEVPLLHVCMQASQQRAGAVFLKTVVFWAERTGEAGSSNSGYSGIVHILCSFSFIQTELLYSLLRKVVV